MWQQATPEAAVFSFDVFDTLLTTPFGSPQGSFGGLGRRLAVAGAITCSPESFVRLRAAADRRAYARAGGRDSQVDLAAIYGELVPVLTAGSSGADDCVRAEIDHEREVSRSFPGAAAMVRAARERGRVIFISDMHLPVEVISGMLAEHGLLLPGETCYVSGTIGKAKSTGSLFRYVLEAEGCGPDQLVHTGNNLRGDVVRARQAGVRAVHFRAGNLNRFERALDDARWATDGFSSAMAGASRLARFDVRERFATTAPEPAVNVAAGVAAPLLVGYVLWCLGQAARADAHRLVFPTRHGKVLAGLAKDIAERREKALVIECGDRVTKITPQAEPIQDLSPDGAVATSGLSVRSAEVLGDAGHMDTEVGSPGGSAQRRVVIALGDDDELRTELTRAQHLDSDLVLVAYRTDSAPLGACRTEAYLYDGALRLGFTLPEAFAHLIDVFATMSKTQGEATWELGAVLDATYESFVSHLLFDESLVAVDADVREAALQSFSLLAMAPTVPEATVWGARCGSGVEGVLRGRLSGLMRFGRSAATSQPAWPAGSMARSSRIIQIASRFRERGKRLGSRVRRQLGRPPR